MIKKISKNDYALSVFTKIITLLVGLLSTSFLTRYLGIANKGEYAFVNQVVSVAGLILNLGIYQSYTYYYRKEGDVVFGKFVSLSLLQFCVYLVLGMIVSALANNLTVTLICITIPFKVIRSQFDNIMLVQNVKLRMRSTRLASLLTMLAYLALLLLLKSSVIPALAVAIAIDIFVVARYFIKEKIGIRIGKVDPCFAKKVLCFGFLPMLSALLVTLNYSVDVFFLKRMGTPRDLSLYSAATGIINHVWLVPDAFKDILYSRVARNNQKNAIAFSTKFSLLFLIVTTIGFLIFGRLFVRIMYGNEFMPSYHVTMVLFLGVYSMIFFKVFGIVMIAEGKRVPFFLMLLASVILNVVLNCLLIPNYGMYGAAYASVGSYNLCGILFLIYFSRTKNIPIKKLLLIDREDIENIRAFIKNTPKRA